MAGEFYSHTTYPANGAAGSSSAMRSELELIEAGFDKLAGLSGNGGKIIAVNAGATAYEALTTTGTGSAVRATSPTLVTPTLGVATATSINKWTFTAPATSCTFTLLDGKTFTVNNTLTLAGTDGSTLNIGAGGTLGTAAFTASGDYATAGHNHDGTYVTPDGSDTLTNKTLTAPVLGGTVTGTYTLGGTPTITSPAISTPAITNYTETLYAPSAGSAFTVDLANGTIQKFTTNANVTITLPSSAAGKSYLVIVAYGGTHTVTWAGGSTIKWQGGSAPAATSVNGKFDLFVFTCDGTNTYGRSGGSNF